MIFLVFVLVGSFNFVGNLLPGQSLHLVGDERRANLDVLVADAQEGNRSSVLDESI